YPAARTAFETVVRQYPEATEVRMARLRAADCAYYMKDYANAAAGYDVASRDRDRETAREAKYWLAVCRLQQGQKREAMAALAELSGDSQDPKSALRARMRLGELQLAENDAAGAADSYRAAIPLCGSDTAALDQATYGLGLALYRQKKPGEAEAQFGA